MTQVEQIVITDSPSRGEISRRAVIRRLGAIGLSLAGITRVCLQDALAALEVTVARPTVTRLDTCMATISVLLTISSLASGARYEAYGDVMESDEPDGEPDPCCALTPQPILSGAHESHTLLLKGEATAADLGLVKGIGPASDETFSPDLVELFARVWLRDLATGDRYGPWESPPRVAVASSALAWTQLQQFPGSELLTPRGGAGSTAYGRDGIHLPPQACAS